MFRCISIMTFLYSCNNPQKQQSEIPGDSLTIMTDSAETRGHEKETPLISLLNHPLDIKEYKHKKRGANSSVINKEPWYYQPDTVGTYFSYFWFLQLRAKYPAEQLFNGLVVKTYIHGKQLGNYDTVVEDLIGLKSRLADPDLGKLDLVGKEQQFLLTNFGIRPNYREEYIIEGVNGTLLIIYLKDEKVQWFNYLRTHLKLENEDIPEALLHFEEQALN